MKKLVEDGMARALHVNAWADKEEEKGRSHGGEELMDVAPKTPRGAKDAAYRLAGRFEALNKLDIYALFYKAMLADGKIGEDYTGEEFRELWDKYAREFGHYLTMRAIGSGVAWEDNHRKAGIVYPHFGYNYA